MIRSLGTVTTTSGTPVRATANQTDPTARMGCQSITFRVMPGNTAVMYISTLEDTGSPVGTGGGVIAAIAAPADATEGPFPEVTISVPNAPAALDAAMFWIDGTGSLYVSITAQ